MDLLILETRFSLILGTRIGSLKRLKKICLNLLQHSKVGWMLFKVKVFSTCSFASAFTSCSMANKSFPRLKKNQVNPISKCSRSD